MVVRKSTLQELPNKFPVLDTEVLDKDSRIVLNMKDVIDMGAPIEVKPSSRRRRKLVADRKSNVLVHTESIQSSRIPNKLSSNLYSRKHLRIAKSEENKSKKQRNEIVETKKKSVKKLKRWNRLVPNPRLYQPPRPRVFSKRPQSPPQPWSPPPLLGPHQTASQIALLLSTRTVIPFKRFFPLTQEYVEKSRRKQIDRPVKTGVNKLRPKSGKSPLTSSALRTSVVSPRRIPGVLSASAKRRQTTIKKRPLSPLGANTAKRSTHRYRDPSPFQSYSFSPERCYIPRSHHLRLAPLKTNSSTSTLPPAAKLTTPTLVQYPTIMASTPQYSPEDGSDGNESTSAPSEYLAEFLSAIMSRKYAEALKYCTLILYYEPENTTARGFYPLLREKVAEKCRKNTNPASHEGKVQGSSTSEESGSSGADIPHNTRSTDTPGEMKYNEENSDSESDESVASLSLDSSGKSSRSCSPAARGIDSTSEESVELLGVKEAKVTTAKQGCWLADDNGNPSLYTHKTEGIKKKCKKMRSVKEDEENDNAAGDHKLLLTDPTLRQLRAQFACSIK